MKFKVGQNVVLKETGEKCRVIGYTKNGLVTLAKADGRLYGDFAEEAIASNSCASNAKFKVGDKVAVRSGGYGKIVAIKPNGMYKIEGGGMEGSFPESELVKVANSIATTNPVVQNALKAKNGKFGFDLAAAVALKCVKDARTAMQKARLYIGQAEDDDEAPGQARDMDKIIKEIDNLIGWLKDYA